MMILAISVLLCGCVSVAIRTPRHGESGRVRDCRRSVPFGPVWTVEDHLTDKPREVRILFEAFERLVGACGSYEGNVTRVTPYTKKPSRRGRTSLSDLTERVHDHRNEAENDREHEDREEHVRDDRPSVSFAALQLPPEEAVAFEIPGRRVGTPGESSEEPV